MGKIINRFHLVYYIIPVCIAGLLGVYRLGDKSLWLDEVLTLRIAAQDWGVMWQTLMTTEPYRWFYYILLHFWMHFGSGDTHYRLLSVLVGLASIPGMYLLGKSISSRRVGIISSFLLAIHPMYQRYMQEVHSYSLLLSLSIWSSYLFVLFMRRPTLKRMAVYVLCALLMVYSHNFGVFVLAAQYLSLLYFKRVAILKRLYIISILILALGLFPFLVFTIPQQNIAWISLPNWPEISNFFILLSGGHVILAVGMACLCLYSGLAIRETKSVNHTKEMIFIFIWLVFPLVSVLAVSFLLRPIFVARYMIIILPAFIILVSSGLARLSKVKMLLVVFALTGLMLASNHYWYTGKSVYSRLGFVTYTDQEDWKGVTGFILRRSRPTDAVVFYPYFVRFPFEYYRNQYSKIPAPRLLELSSGPYTIGGSMPEPDTDTIRGLPQYYGRVWLILSHNMNSSLGRDRQTTEIRNELDGIYPHHEEAQYQGITAVLYY